MLLSFGKLLFYYYGHQICDYNDFTIGPCTSGVLFVLVYLNDFLSLFCADVWGQCKARHGGIPSMVCEFVRFMGVVEYLDAPSSIVSRLVCRNQFPYNFPGPDRPKPQREAVDKEVKIFHMFNYVSKGKAV